MTYSFTMNISLFSGKMQQKKILNSMLCFLEYTPLLPLNFHSKLQIYSGEH